MRTRKGVLIMVVAAALVLSSASVALANGRGGRGGVQATYLVTRPETGGPVTAGMSFDATGLITPPIVVDDASTTVSVEVFSVPGRGRPLLLQTVPASLSTASDTTGTVYDATITLPLAGPYTLVTVVQNGGTTVGQSKPSCVYARLPHAVTKPALASDKVTMGVSFDATGVVTPAIAVDDASTTVSVEVFSLPKRGRPVLVSTVPAVLTPTTDAAGSVYDASIVLPQAGPYALVAIVQNGGVTLGQSKARLVSALLPYVVTKPSVLSQRVNAGDSFDATGVVTPAIAADDTSTTIDVLVYHVGRRGRLTLVSTVAGTFTGPDGDGTDYSATISLANPGRYVLVALVSSDGPVVGRSCGRTVVAAAPAPAVSGRTRRR
jgi:hypothetical protein